MTKVRILINNNKSRVVAGLEVLAPLRDRFKIRAPGAFFSPLFRKRQWDGYIKYVSEVNGMFATGLLDQVCNHLDAMKVKYTLEDAREPFKEVRIPEKIGGNKLYGYQLDAVKSILDNRYKGVRFQRGIIDAATNAGKSYVAAGIYAAYASKRQCLFLINNTEIFEQIYEDLCQFFPEQVGLVSSKKTVLGKRITVAMIQTLGPRLRKDPKLRQFLAKMDIVIVDEADELIGAKACKSILAEAFNATVRVALTGTALKHKDPTRNQELLAYFGPIVYTITNVELVAEGVSTPPDIRMCLGNAEHKLKGDYAGEYRKGIIKNRKRHKRIWNIIKKQTAKGRIPAIILFKEHDHGYDMLKRMPEELKHLKVALVHGDTKNRRQIFADFKAGKIDILLSSMIIKRGKNLPLIKTLVNAAGGTSEANVLQILGRALRKHESKKKVYVYDFWDIGAYLQPHSRRRLKYYKNQKFEVRELYKKPLRKLTIK